MLAADTVFFVILCHFLCFHTLCLCLHSPLFKLFMLVVLALFLFPFTVSVRVEERLESWRYALERRGMKVNRRKTEYMCVNERQVKATVKMQREEVAKV